MIEIECEIVGKWIKGLIFKKPMLSLKLKNFNPEYYDIPVIMAQYNAVEKGQKIIVAFYKHIDGFYYHWKEV